MRVLRRPCAHGPLYVPWVSLCVAVALCGCGRTATSPAESARLDTEYVAIEDRETSTILTLARDGTFSVREEERYEADSTRVEILARADTLSSLRWVTSTEGSPFSACDLVSMSEFDEFLHPTEGSGSSGW